MKGFFSTFSILLRNLEVTGYSCQLLSFFYFCDCLVEKSLEAKALKEFPLQSAISHISLNWKVN